MKPPLKANNRNDFQTPVEALAPLLPYLKKDWTIWECAEGKGNLVKHLQALGYRVIGSDILDGRNFLSWQPEHFDCIVTNPPYSIKQQFIERAYKLRKPFAFLLPLTTLETANRQRFFKEYGVELILFDKRINFQTPSGNGKGAWFATMWVTLGLNIGYPLTFVELQQNMNMELFK